MKNIKFYFVLGFSFLFLVIIYIIFKFYILENIYSTDFRKNNSYILENKEELSNLNNLVKNEKYGYEIQSSYEKEFKNNNKFLILKDNNCVLNLVSFENNKNINVYSWVENECLDLNCDNYICEYYKNDWYKVRYFGDFMGSSDYELVFQNDNYIYSANIECSSDDLDNYENILFSDLILNFKVKKND